jgi:hypothetical protein
MSCERTSNVSEGRHIGTSEYIAQFYNGGTYLDEVLEDGIKNTLK